MWTLSSAQALLALTLVQRQKYIRKVHLQTESIQNSKLKWCAPKGCIVDTMEPCTRTAHFVRFVFDNSFASQSDVNV